MQESRLFKILYYLLDKGSATAPELAERFEVSVRTIYRDIDALSGAGIPVYTEQGRKGGIYLLEDAVLNKTMISEQEKQEILSALQGFSVVSGEYEKDTFEKLSALFRVPAVDWIEVDLTRWGAKPQDNKRFEDIKTAILQNRCMRISYANAKGEVDTRKIEPLKLSYKSKDWYVKAFCMLKQDFRLFKINRILEWELLEEKFVSREFPDTFNTGAEACNTITLRFSKEMAYRVYDEFDINQIECESDGSFRVVVDMREDEWLIGYLLSFGTQVDIIEPVYLKEIIAQRAKEIYIKIIGQGE